MVPPSPNQHRKERLVEPDSQVDAMTVIDALAMEVAVLTKRAVIAEQRIATMLEEIANMKESK